MLHLRARKGYVLMERAASAAALGSILIPEAYRHRMQEGLAVAVGPDVRDVQPGQRVLVDRWLGTEFVLSGRTFCAVEERHVFGVFDEVSGT